MSKIGDPIKTGVSNPVDGKPEHDWYKQVKAQLDEITARVSNPSAIPAVSSLASPCTGGQLTLTGALAALSATITAALSAASAAISGNETVGGTLGVTGTTTLGVLNAGASTLGATSASALTTAEADVHHGSRSLMLHWSEFQWEEVPNGVAYPASSCPSPSTGSLSPPTNTNNPPDRYRAPIALCIGDRITSIILYCHATTTVAQVTLKAFKTAMTSGGTATQLGSTQSSTNAGGDQTLTISGLTETVADATGYMIEMSMANNTVAALYGAKVVYDRP